MNTEEVAAAKQIGMEQGLEEGKKEGLITGVQNLISVMKDYGESNQGFYKDSRKNMEMTFLMIN